MKAMARAILLGALSAVCALALPAAAVTYYTTSIVDCPAAVRPNSDVYIDVAPHVWPAHTVVDYFERPIITVGKIGFMPQTAEFSLSVSGEYGIALTGQPSAGPQKCIAIQIGQQPIGRYSIGLYIKDGQIPITRIGSAPFLVLGLPKGHVESQCQPGQNPLINVSPLTPNSTDRVGLTLGVGGISIYAASVTRVGNVLNVVVSGTSTPVLMSDQCTSFSIDPIPPGTNELRLSYADDYEEAGFPPKAPHYAGSKTIVVGGPATTFENCPTLAGNFDVSPSPADSSQPIRIRAGQSSYDPVAMSVDVRGNTIDAILTALEIGFLPPDRSCATATIPAMPSGIYTVNLFRKSVRDAPGPQVLLESKTLEISGPPAELSGLWWNASESGWGINLTQRGNNVFAVWYTYDAAGNPKWYVAPHCQLPGTGASGKCVETLYEVKGPKFFGVGFNPAAAQVKDVGTMELTFSDVNAGSMKYTVAGQTRTVPISRQPISSGATPPAINYTDLWWNPDESGWGMAVTHSYDVMFLAWFVYDGSGAPVWYVASNCTVKASKDGCDGTLYRTTGPALGPTFDVSKVKATAVGSVSLSFPTANDASLLYTVDGVASSKVIKRQVF